jgi:sigma54-dependent transcription regulator
VAEAKTGARTATASRAPKSLAQPPHVTQSDVARRAYDLHLARGCRHGHDVDDWLQAERELRAPSTTA